MEILLFAIFFYPAPSFSHPPQVLERGVPGGPPAQSSARVQQHLCLGLEPVQEPHLSLQVNSYTDSHDSHDINDGHDAMEAIMVMMPN